MNTNGAAASTALESEEPSKHTLKERAAKIYKQHMEIVKLRHELTSAIEEKQALEQEIKSRNQEVYEMNEKMIFMEYEKQAEANKQLASLHDTNKVQDLKAQLEKCQDNNIRRILDM